MKNEVLKQSLNNNYSKEEKFMEQNVLVANRFGTVNPNHPQVHLKDIEVSEDTIKALRSVGITHFLEWLPAYREDDRDSLVHNIRLKKIYTDSTVATKVSQGIKLANCKRLLREAIYYILSDAEKVPYPVRAKALLHVKEAGLLIEQ